MFSIIIPTYNNASEISRALNSILEQTYENWELIIVDDGSTDDTQAILKPYLKDKRVKYVYQFNQGVSVARNKGIEFCKEKFITFLDADDTVNKHWLTDFYKLTINTVQAGYLSGAVMRNSKLILPKLESEISEFRYSSLAGTFAINRYVMIAIKGYDTNLRQSENWEMTARALEYCEINNLEILHHENPNINYDNYPTREQTLLRDKYRAEAVLYLYQKYSKAGVFHYRKNDFLVSSAINFTRAGNISKARSLFYKCLFNKPSMEALYRILLFEVPTLRNKKWKR